MCAEVNYIRHLECVVENFVEDERLTPWHISLYYALFHSWNSAKFQNPISINRTEMMNASKIGSVNTYSRALRELHLWGYIEYQPSRSSHKGSKVHMFIFDTTSDTTTDTTADTTAELLLIQQLRPSINNKKHIKPLKQEEAKRFRPTKSATKLTSRPDREDQKVEGKGSKNFSPPTLDEVKVYFEQEKAPPEQAEQFYDHFTANGWLVGGKSKMKDWNAAARNWIRRSFSFRTSTTSPSLGIERSRNANYLNADPTTDYTIPL